MHLSAEQKQILRKSHQQILPEVERISQKFYPNLFAREPGLKKLFRDDLDAQGMRFMAAVSVIIDNLDDPEKLDREVALLADGHAAFNLKASSYREMEQALIDTFAWGLGEKFTNEVELAWRSAFGQVCAAMMAKAGTH